MTQNAGEERAKTPTVWLLVDNSARALALDAVAERLDGRGINAEVVTITEVIGSMARSALAGGAERLLRGLRVAVQNRGGDEDLIGAVRRARPDVLAVTDARYVRALSVLESVTGIASLQVGVLPDYNLNDAWIDSGLHAFVVPHDELAARLERRVPAERVLVAGPAVLPGFDAELDRAALRSEFGFSASEKLVLVRADTFATSMLEKLVFQCRLVEGARFLFHHNGDASAASTLRRAANEQGLQAVMFGKVDDPARYFAVADCAIVAPQEPLSAELIALGLPLLLVGPPGDRGAHVSFLESHSMGRHVPELLRLGAEIERFLGDDRLAKYAEAARTIGLPGGSDEVADAISRLCEKAEEWLGAPADAPGGDGGGDDAPSRDDAPRGPFESIGSGGGAGAGRDEGVTFGTPSDDEAGGDGGGRDAAPARDPDHNPYAGISRAEAKEQLAQLILMERDLERRLGELDKEQQRWRSRLDLAREWNEVDLENEAESILREFIAESDPLRAELADVRLQKSKLKAAANPNAARKKEAERERGPGASRLAELEQRFRKMEDDRDLDALKGRIDREFGD
jgi:hypothetical protein